eukprot:750501-Hanusia_phi.AAC.4
MEQKPSKAPKKYRKQMRSHPLFQDVLRAYVLCKRPVLGPIPPLEASEEVLFKEFAEEDHPSLKETFADNDPKEETAPEVSEEEMTNFLQTAISSLKQHREEVESLIKIRDACCDQYLEFLKNTWTEHLQARTDPKVTGPASDLKMNRPSVDHSSSSEQDPNAQRPEKRRRENLPSQSVSVLKEWMRNNIKRPYPTDQDKVELAALANITTQQVSNWFVNARKRIWQQMLEDKFGRDQANAFIPSKPPVSCFVRHNYSVTDRIRPGDYDPIAMQFQVANSMTSS